MIKQLPWQHIHPPFAWLPTRFLYAGLLLYVVLETLASLLMQYGASFQADELMLVLIVRSLELLGFGLLIWHFKLLNTLGLNRPKPQDIQIFLQLSLICVAAVLLLYAIQSAWFVYIAIPSWLNGLAGLLLMVVIAPIVEEIMFRGLLYRMLREQWGVAFSVAVSAVFFSLLHQGSLISPQLAGGIIFALAYEWSRSLWLPIALHIGANAAVYGLAMLASVD